MMLIEETTFSTRTEVLEQLTTIGIVRKYRARIDDLVRTEGHGIYFAANLKRRVLASEQVHRLTDFAMINHQIPFVFEEFLISIDHNV